MDNELKIAILTTPGDASPKVLSFSLKAMLEKEQNVKVDILYKLKYTSHLLPLFGKNKRKLSFHFRLIQKLKGYFKGRFLIKELKKFDVIIVSSTEPRAFKRDVFNIEILKTCTKKPVLFHEVYYLGNFPSHIEWLRANGHHSIKRFDWHLSVSNLGEIRMPSNQYSHVGLNFENTCLVVPDKKKLFAIVDFKQNDYEEYRNAQIEILKQNNIDFIAFDHRMPIEEIRAYYRRATLYFMQSPETFGVPIAECLNCGCAIFTPSSAWPMSWRLDQSPSPNSKGKLPDCFVEYNSNHELNLILGEFKNNFDEYSTHIKLYESFKKHYPEYISGNQHEIKKLIEKIRNRNFDEM